MSEVRDPEKKPEHEKKNDRDFISEKIVRPAPSKKQVGTRMATAACAGIIFGVVSAKLRKPPNVSYRQRHS